MATVLPPPPLKPHPEGHIAHVYGGPATSAADVLRRARNALAPRGAWSATGWHSKNVEGVGRCALQVIKDVDGPYESTARSILLESIRELHPKISSVETWNDADKTKKPEVLDRFDRAIQIAENRGK